jgi:putative spermidine/putrescine transport system substrate-binding protein
MINRRKMLAGLGGAAATSWARGTLASDKPASMTLSTYGGDYGRLMKMSYMDAFTAKTGINLLPDIGENPQRLAKLRTYRKQPRFSLINLQDRFLYQATREGLLETIDYSLVPNAVDIPDMYKKKTWFPYNVGYIGIIYNTERVKTPPKTWADVIDERYKGRIFLDDFDHFGMHYTLGIAMANGGGYDDIMPGMKIIQEIKQKLEPRFITTSQEGMKLLGDGDVDIAIWQKARSLQLKQQGKPIEYVSPTSGSISYSYGNGIVKGDRWNDWAHAYMDSTASPDGQVRDCAAELSQPTNTKAKLPPELLAFDPNPKEAGAIQLDYDQVLPRLDEWTKLWNRLIAS